MQTWEYLTLKRSSLFNSKLEGEYGGIKQEGKIEEILNLYGSEGWEVCGMTHDQAGGMYQIVLKRPKNRGF